MRKDAGTGASTKRERVAWYLYDFGNSAYASIILLAVFAVRFQDVIVGGARGSWLWGLALGIAMLVVALLSPLLGALADFTASKKRFLGFFTAMSCVFTGALFFVGKGDIVLGMILFILAEIGYRSAQVFYDALLPEIATEKEIGRVSGLGWAIGSVGGILIAVIVTVLLNAIGGELVTRATFLLTAAYFALFSLPTFLWLRERGTPQKLPKGETLLRHTLRRLGTTLRAIRHFREFAKFLLAFLVYNDGVIMTLNFAAILGGVLYGLSPKQLPLFSVLVQATSVLGAYLFGRVADRTSAKRSLVVSLILMVAATAWLYFNQSLPMFFVIGALSGFALTGVQSVSRTMIGLLAPAGRSGEFYGFFSVAGRTSSFIGPTVFGIVAAGMAQVYERGGTDATLASQHGHRIAVLSILAFLIVGLVLLLWVNERRGRDASRSPAAATARTP